MRQLAELAHYQRAGGIDLGLRLDMTDGDMETPGIDSVTSDRPAGQDDALIGAHGHRASSPPVSPSI